MEPVHFQRSSQNVGVRWWFLSYSLLRILSFTKPNMWSSQFSTFWSGKAVDLGSRDHEVCYTTRYLVCCDCTSYLLESGCHHLVLQTKMGRVISWATGSVGKPALTVGSLVLPSVQWLFTCCRDCSVVLLYPGLLKPPQKSICVKCVCVVFFVWWCTLGVVLFFNLGTCHWSALQPSSMESCPGIKWQVLSIATQGHNMTQL